MTKIRGFELVSTYTNQDLLPKQETAHAAGYDLKVAERTVIAPGKSSSFRLVLRPICKLERCSISMTDRPTLAKRPGLNQLCGGLSMETIMAIQK